VPIVKEFNVNILPTVVLMFWALDVKGKQRRNVKREQDDHKKQLKE
jgi:hypothetical protein